MLRRILALVCALAGGCSFDLDAIQVAPGGVDAGDTTSDGTVESDADGAAWSDAASETAPKDTGSPPDTSPLVDSTFDAGDDPPLDPAVCKAAGTPFACFQCCTTKLPIGAGNAWKGSSGCFCHPSHCKFQCKDTACSKGMADADQPCAACLNSNLTACGPDIPPSSKRFVDCVGGC